MRRVPKEYTGIIIASLVFVLLIGLVEIGELDRSGPAGRAASDTVDSATVETTVDTQAQPDCTQVESGFAAKLEESRSCIVDADCSLANFGCPFECVTSVSKPLLDDLQREEGLFQQACQRCMSSCPAMLDKWRAACVRQRCIVLDRSIEELQEETLRLIDESS